MWVVILLIVLVAVLGSEGNYLGTFLLGAFIFAAILLGAGLFS